MIIKCACGNKDCNVSIYVEKKSSSLTVVTKRDEHQLVCLDKASTQALIAELKGVLKKLKNKPISPDNAAGRLKLDS